MLTISNQDSKRIYGLNDKAVKAARESATALQAAAAAGMYMLMHGASHFINDLYNKLADEKAGSPKDAEALRVMYTGRVIDLFGKGGIRRTDDTTKWLRRPTAFFTFSSAKKDDGTKEGFKLVDVKNNTTLTATQLAEVKQARKEIREAGEQALNFIWKTQDKEERDAETMDAAALQRMVKTFLVRVAKNAKTNGMEKNKITASAKLFGLNADAIGKVLEAYDDGSHDAGEDDDETAVMEDEVKKPEITPEVIVKPKNKGAEPAHA